MQVTFEPVRWPDDRDAAVEFLMSSEWPFHGAARLSREQATAIDIAGDDVVSFWIRDGSTAIGLIRVFDLDDLDDGSPLFDLRLAAEHRGGGIGTAAVRWLTGHLFTTHPQLVRIEATTRHDNPAMQTVFDRCGYRQEGRLVEAWVNADGTRSDTLVYATLRREWSAGAGSTGR